MSVLFLLLTAQAALHSPAPAGWVEYENVWVVALIYLGLVAVGLVVDAFLLVRLLRSPGAWARHVSRLNWRPWTWGEAGRIAGLLLALHFAGLLAYRAIHAGTDVPEGADDTTAVVMQSIVFHWAGLALIAASLRRRSLSWRSAFGLDLRAAGRRAWQGVAFYLGIIPILWFYSLLYQAGLRQAGYETGLQEVAWAITTDRAWWARAYLLSLAVVIAPLLEELLFRGVGLPLFAQRVGVGKAVFLVSALFALMHFHLPSLVPLFVIAVGFSLAYLYTESILVPAVMHALFNAVNLSLILLLRGT